LNHRKKMEPEPNWLLPPKQRWRTCSPQKNFVQPVKHSSETSSCMVRMGFYYFCLLFVSIDEQFFSFLTDFIVW